MIGYLVTFRTDNGPRRGRNVTVTVYADSEYEAAEQLKTRQPKAVVLATTHPES